MRKILIASSIAICSSLLLSCGGGSSSGGALPSGDSGFTGTVIDSTTRADNGGSGVMLQGFTWTSTSKPGTWYANITTLADTIKENFEYVWFPPASDCTDTTGNGYLPRELNLLTTKTPAKTAHYGTEEELFAAIEAIKPAKAIEDVVINHRCGTKGWGDFTNPSWGENYSAICSDDEGFTSPTSGMMGAEIQGAKDTGEGYEAARDIDHTNKTVQDGICTWMNDILKTKAGFVGWRYDYVKGYAGKYVGYYNAQTEAEISVGEYWPTQGFNPSAWNKEITSWIKSTAQKNRGVQGKASRAFDFILKGNLNSVFGSNVGATNSRYDLLANENNLFRSLPGYAVTFVGNHDTDGKSGSWKTDTDDIGAAYVFILSHPGYPCVSMYHYFAASDCPNDSYPAQYMGDSVVPGTSETLKELITGMIALRKSAGISDLSNVETLVATSSQYVGKITGTAKTLVVALGASYDCPAGYSEEVSGTGFQVYSTETVNE